jgi:PAS domain S-box-containing protein
MHLEQQILDISVLYVEDDLFIRKVMLNILSKNLREVYTAENGLEGLNLYKRLQPDIVLTDIRMPVMDGLEMASQIRSLNKTAPIIVTTAYGDTENLLRSIEIGIDSYVLKPIDKNKLLTVLRKYAEEIILRKKLREQEEATATTHALLMAAIEQSPSGILVFDAPTGNIRIANAAALAIRGETNAKLVDISMMQQPQHWGFCHPDGRPYKYYELPQSIAIMTGATIKDLEMLIKRDSGEVRWVLASASPVMDSKNNIVASILILQDITERRRLSEQLHQAQKMEAVGQLTGGIAHDFNNILTAIIGYGSLIRNNLGHDDTNRLYIDQVLKSAEKAADLTKNLLAFSRKQIISPKKTNLNETVASVQRLISRLIGEDIELNINLHSEDIPVFVDSGLIEQVLLNLAANARDAMPKGGKLEITTTVTTLNENGLVGKDDHRKYALIRVRDTGTGIEQKIIDKIFEPFFTTKEKGKGTGLGLAMAYGIIKQHNGYIFVSSEVGKGTEFRIYLPLFAKEFEGTAPTNKQGDSTAPKGTETVLLAEDSDDVRGITREILLSHGYKVIEAIDGEEAVEKFKQTPESIDLLLFDVIMPKKNGKEAYEEIKRLRPDVKVLFLSGYATDILSKRNMLEEGINFLPKPVTPPVLLKKVRDVLDVQ